MTATEIAVPEQLGDFRILRHLATGGMGHVYLAEQVSLEREVVVKILRGCYSRDEHFIQRFQREARSAARLQHPNIIQIHFVGEEQGLHYFAMEYVAGCNLKEYLRQRSRLSVFEALDVVIKVADALACAARLNIVHRDLKPENVMLTPESRVKVADFGLAKCMLDDTRSLSQDGRLIGTVNYMSPEQGLGQTTDIRSDIYSLGVLFYELLAGRTPFKGEHPTSVIYMHVYEPPPPLTRQNQSVPREIEDIVHRMMAKDPRDRPQTPDALLTALEEARTRCGLSRANRRQSAILPLPLLPGRPVCLIADADDPPEEFLRQLRHHGYSVARAHDGLEALQAWRRDQPRLVLLDQDLPELSGSALLEEWRRRGLTGDVMLLAHTPNPQVIRRSAMLGARGYLLKPLGEKAAGKIPSLEDLTERRTEPVEPLTPEEGGGA